jgi:hypothetical protein
MERLKSLTLPSDNDAKDMPDSIESNALLPCLLVQVNVLSSALTFRKDNLTSHFTCRHNTWHSSVLPTRIDWRHG